MVEEFYPRDFEGVWIPKEIYLNPNLNAQEKIIFAEINSLDRHLSGGDYCYASNEYLAKFSGCGITKVSTTITRLVQMGYLQIVKTDGRKRWIKSLLKERLSDFERQTNKICESNFQKMKERNISINTINNINSMVQQDCTSEFSVDVVINQVSSICSRNYPDVDVEKVKDIIVYYLNRYYQCFGKNHPKMKNDSYDNVICFINSHDYSLVDYQMMIDGYFQKKFAKKVDYNMLHFFTEGITKHRMYEKCGKGYIQE